MDTLPFSNPTPAASNTTLASAPIADRGEFWWDPKRPDEPMLWDSKIRLGEDFFSEIIRHPVPLDMNTLNALKRCSLGLDLYLWLAYRTFSLKRPAQGSTRVEEDQAGLAGSELLDGSGRPDPLAFEARRPSGAAASAREIALNFPLCQVHHHRIKPLIRDITAFPSGSERHRCAPSSGSLPCCFMVQFTLLGP